MSVNTPLTTWQDAENEMGTQGEIDFATLAGARLVTLSGATLVLNTSTATAIPATTWTQGFDA